MNKKLVVIYSEDDWELVQPNFGIAMNVFYSIFHESCKKYGLELYRSSTRWLNENLQFNKCWKYLDNSWIKMEEPLVPDYIYDYSSTYDIQFKKDYLAYSMLNKLYDSYTMLNNPSFTELVGDKINQVVLFKEYLPKTFIKTKDDVLSKPRFEFVVKAANGSGGSSVTFNNEIDLKSHNELIVQELIDGRDLTGTLKDYRFTFVDNVAIYAETRQAPIGILKTNCSQGAFNKFYMPNEMPKDLFDFAQKVASKLNSFKHNVFTVDLLKEKESNKIYLMETNTKPGLGLYKDKKEIEYDSSALLATQNFTTAIIKSLMNLETQK